MKLFDVLSSILSANRFTTENISDLEKKLFFEGNRKRPYLVRFAVLIILSTIIASGGIAADSTATVIGAMIVAPLMTPILATTAALVMGSVKRTVRSMLIVIGGILVVLLISWIIGNISTSVLSFDTNSQISSRISPNLTDLMVALAAGAAGAFAFSRDDVADSLPGVAIAIALVPPLCVIGFSLAEERWVAALGATILFLTNFLSILLAGGAIFALLNLGPAAINRQDLTREGQRKAYTYIAIGVLLVAIPLAVTSYKIGQDSILQGQVKAVTVDWLEEGSSDLRLSAVLINDNTADIFLQGFSLPPDVEKLGFELTTQIPKLDKSRLLVNLAQEMPVPMGLEGE